MEPSSSLPTELIVDILSRVPVKPLLRFKSVSKLWYHLIRSPTFIKLHVTQSLTSPQTTNRHVIISYTSLSSSVMDLPTLSFGELDHPLKPVPKEDTLNYFPEPTGVELLGSCNGVVCISNASKNSVFLYCPGTRTWHGVAPTHVPYPEDYVVFGFGYSGGDREEEDYKVLRIIQCREKHCHVKFYNEAKVYSLRNKCWKWVNDLNYFLVYKDAHAVFVDQGLHLVVHREGTNMRTKAIVRFDLKTEVFSLIDLPNFEDEFGVSKLVLRKLGGCLCVMVNYSSGSYADLWSMKVYGKKDSWVKMLSVEMSPRFAEVRPVGYSKDKGSVLLLIDNCELQWCELSVGSKRVKLLRGYAMLDEPFDAGFYVDSVVSLDDWSVVSPTKQKKNYLRDTLDDFLSVGFKLRL